MRLEDYDHPPGIRGLHSCAAFDKPNRDREKWADEYAALGMNWAKLLDDGHGSNFAFAKMLEKRGITPIIRLWKESPLPGGLEVYHYDTAEHYVGEGITKWFEILNEPNLPIEWQSGDWEAYHGRRHRTMVTTWLYDAQQIIELGGYPAFPAMAQCGRTPELGSILWYEQSFKIMAEDYYDRAKWVFENGAWIASHDAVLNHCYFDANGWHFECPYDLIEQEDHPSTSIFGGDNSLIGHLVPVVLLKKYFGLTVPVISTEGGVFVPKSGWSQWDTRYPGYDYEGHAERTVAMYRWLERYQATFPWYFGMCPWLMANSKMGHQQPAWREDGWYHDVRGKLPVVQAVKDMGGPLENPQPFDYQKWPGWDLGDQQNGSNDQGDGSMEQPIRLEMLSGGVATLELEEYLKGVVPYEMGPGAPTEALKAQAVAARCYAMNAIKSPRHAPDADVCTTTHCQVWNEGQYLATNAIIDATKGVVATYNGQVISAFYFGHCDGSTRNCENVWVQALPYCRAVDCPCGYTEMYGHGVGMCQQGAIRMAQRGASYKEILWHYYTGVAVDGQKAPLPINRDQEILDELAKARSDLTKARSHIERAEEFLLENPPEK